MPRELPPQVSDFIRNYIDSVEELEIVLLLSALPEKVWTIDSIYAEIRSNPKSIRRRLGPLVANGLVAARSSDVPEFAFGPATPELTAAVQALGSVYREFRVAVIERIFAKPLSPIQGFADAFRIRKGEIDG